MVETLAANGADEPVVFHDWIDGQGRPIVYAKGAFGLSAQPIEFLQRHIELSKDFEEQRRADFPSTMQWDGNGPSIAVRPAFVAAGLRRLTKPSASAAC
jgi:hypothetical protein